MIKKIINKRPVAIVAQGTSVRHLRERIKDFKDKKWCWTSLNHFNLVEPIVEKINRKFEMIYCSAPIRCVQNAKEIHRFVQKGVWITAPDVGKVFSYKNMYIDHSPAHGRYNTLIAFVIMLMRMEVETVILFGADGGSRDGKTVYYGQGRFKLNKEMEGDMSDKPHQLRNDSDVVNNTWHDFLNQHKIYSKTRVINVSVDSYLKVFERVSYDEVINAL